MVIFKDGVVNPLGILRCGSELGLAVTMRVTV